MSQEIDVLVSQAREGKFTPTEFCKALDRLGINHKQRMFYMRDVFGIPLQQAKKVILESESGSIEAWSEEIGGVINDQSTNVNDLDDIAER